MIFFFYKEIYVSLKQGSCSLFNISLIKGEYFSFALQRLAKDWSSEQANSHSISCLIFPTLSNHNHA